MSQMPFGCDGEPADQTSWRDSEADNSEVGNTKANTMRDLPDGETMSEGSMPVVHPPAASVGGDGEAMKALSLLQPWAYLAVLGEKGFETRSWNTNYRGPLLIHAGKRFNSFARDFAISVVGVRREELVFGAIIGKVVLKDTWRTETISARLSAGELLYGDYTLGRWAWELADAEMFEKPIPCKGQLGLFEVYSLVEV